jgi:two-component system chemotaxis response regulator CheY
MGKRILIVDDSAAIRQSVSFILEQEGYEVAQAANGAEGLNRMKQDRFQMLVTDVNMPEMDGIELVRQARGLSEYKFIPMVVLTTESQDSKMSEGKAAGATGWIVKPFDAEKLLGVVRKLLG